jgi:hypothetical protein
VNDVSDPQYPERAAAQLRAGVACLVIAVLGVGCGEDATDANARQASDPPAATASPTADEEAAVLAETSGDEPTGQDQTSSVVDDDLIEFGFGVNDEQNRLVKQVEADGVEVVASAIAWDEPDGPVLVVYVSDPWEPPEEDAFEFPVRVVEAEAVDEATLRAASHAWFDSDLGKLVAVGVSLDLIPPGGLEIGLNERFETRLEVRSIGHTTQIRLLPDGDEPTPDPFTLTVPVTTYFAGEESPAGG